MTSGVIPSFRETEDQSQAQRRLQRWLNERCGIYFPDNKLDLMAQRLARVVDTFHLESLAELAGELEDARDEQIAAAVTHAASTNHTYFFRESQTLEFLSSTILPALGGHDEIRIWSAAASTGDEAYSVAIAATQVFDRHIAAAHVKILGTDISGPVIEIAERGVYGSPNLDEVTPEVLNRYFHAVGEGRYRVADDIKRMCTFRRMNLKAQPYPFQRKFDIVLCRNVLYYFEPPTQRDVLEAIYDVTAPNGWLLTSVTVSLRDLRTRWVTVGSGIYRKLA